MFAISSTFTAAPNGVDLSRSRLKILLNFEPHQGTRVGVPMCLNVLTFLCARPGSWFSRCLCDEGRGNMSTALFALTYRILPHTCVKVCNMVACGINLRQAMAEKSARYDALQRVQHCRAACSARSSRRLQRTEKATPPQRRSTSSHAPAKKRKRLRAVLNLQRLEPPLTSSSWPLLCRTGLGRA